MSANFILEYAGAPVRFAGDVPELVSEPLAEHFSAEHEAWYAAWRAGLVPWRCRVVNLYERGREKYLQQPTFNAQRPKQQTDEAEKFFEQQRCKDTTKSSSSSSKAGESEDEDEKFAQATKNLRDGSTKKK